MQTVNDEAYPHDGVDDAIEALVRVVKRLGTSARSKRAAFLRSQAPEDHERFLKSAKEYYYVVTLVNEFQKACEAWEQARIVPAPN